jgi:L-iditol 2-dehydrogenase
MKALVYLGPKELELQDMEIPKDDVVIKVKESGICGTDLKTFLKGHPMFKPPVILGHECYGEVVGMTSDIPGITLGDLVAVAPYIECGKCEMCKRGVPELCKNKTYVETGCFAEYISMSREHARKALKKIPSDRSVFTLIEPLACVLNGFEKIGHCSNMLVVGGGPMGALFAITAQDKGINVSVVETSDWRRKYLQSQKIELCDKCEEMKFDAIVMAVNKPELVNEYLGNVENGGVLLLFSGYPSKSTLNVDPYSIHYREVGLFGCFGFAGKHFNEAKELIERNPKNYERLITHQFSFAEAKKAFSLLNHAQAMKIILRS